jgi:hypothetical protein
MTEAELINKVASFLNVKSGKLEFNDEQVFMNLLDLSASAHFFPIILFSQILKVITRVTPKLKCSGLSTILNTIVRESTHDLAKRSNPIYLQNWFDYVRMFCLTGDKQINQQLVKELNSVFSSRSYLIDQYLTVADVALFYSLQTIMVRLRLIFSVLLSTFDTG